MAFKSYKEPSRKDLKTIVKSMGLPCKWWWTKKRIRKEAKIILEEMG